MNSSTACSYRRERVNTGRSATYFFASLTVCCGILIPKYTVFTWFINNLFDNHKIITV